MAAAVPCSMTNLALDPPVQQAQDRGFCWQHLRRTAARQKRGTRTVSSDRNLAEVQITWAQSTPRMQICSAARNALTARMTKCV